MYLDVSQRQNARDNVKGQPTEHPGPVKEKSGLAPPSLDALATLKKRCSATHDSDALMSRCDDALVD